MARFQSGYTLVEMVAILVILAVLGAIAIPKFVNHTREARIASLSGLAGAIRSSVNVVQGKYTATGATGTTVTLSDGTTVTVSSAGIPVVASGGIDNAVKNDSTFTYTAASGTWNFASGTVANCNVVYAAAGTTTVNTGGC